MSDDIVIKVENLSKQYRIGSREGYKTFRETLVDAAKAPFLRAGESMRSVLRARSKDINSLPHATGPIPSSQGDDYIWALKDVSFEAKRGEVVGIIGRNGAGKSTLLKILSQITEPTSGRVELRGRVGSLLEVGTGFHPELTGHENVYLYGAILGMDRWEVTRKFDEIIAFAELEKFVDTPVKRYSSGMYMRLAFSVAAHLEPEILLVDEVLAVGDAAFQKKCLGKMGEVSREGRTVLFVSHNMGAVENLCDSAILLDSGVIHHTGPTAETIELYMRKALIGKEKRKYAPHVIFDIDSDKYLSGSNFEVLRVEVLDKDNRPMEIVYTWDTVVIKVSFWAPHDVQTGSAILRLTTISGISFMLSSTQPDFKVPMPMKGGQNIVECKFQSLPLSAGEYVVGAGLAIPNKEMLCWNEQAGYLTIHPKDVYKSGMAPIAARSLLAIPHKWRVL